MSIATAPNLNEQRFLLHRVSWQFYEQLLAELGDRPIRVTYDRGSLQLMAPSYRHENYGRTLGRLVVFLCEELDIAIEIDIESSSVNRMAIYAALGVLEVWRFDGQSLHVHCLRPGRKYVRSRSSPTFPAVPPERLARFLGRSTNMDDVQLIRSFRAWVRKEVLPRRKKKP